MRRIDGQIRDMPNPIFSIQACCDVCNDPARLIFRYEYAIRLRPAVVRNSRQFPLLPIASSRFAQEFVDIAIDRDRAECLGGNLLESNKIGRLELSNRISHELP